jgi:hypothetical protein
VLFAFGCAAPGQLYVVAPEISGRLRSERIAVGTTELELDVLQRENASLFARQRSVPDAEGRFAFEASRPGVAGREHTKRYRAYPTVRCSRCAAAVASSRTQVKIFGRMDEELAVIEVLRDTARMEPHPRELGCGHAVARSARRAKVTGTARSCADAPA